MSLLIAMRVEFIINPRSQTRLIMKNEELKSRDTIWVENYETNEEKVLVFSKYLQWKELKTTKPGRNPSRSSARVLAKKEENLATH